MAGSRHEGFRTVRSRPEPVLVQGSADGHGRKAVMHGKRHLRHAKRGSIVVCPLTRPGWDGACPSGRQAFAAADLAAGVKRLHVWVSGTVQGVFFRESARAEAERRGVAGWVRNLPDGRVEAVFEGPAVEAEAMVDWCRRGPP